MLLGVVLMCVSCLAVFARAGAITADRGATRPVAAVAAGSDQSKPDQANVADQPTDTPAPTSAPEQTRLAAATTRSTVAPGAATKPAAASTTPLPQGTVPPKPAAVGPEGNIAQRLDREAVGGSLKLRALGAAKTTQGDRAVLAIYVRMENVGKDSAKVDPSYFKLVDRAGTKYSLSKVIEASLQAIELAPASQPGGAGQNTEGNLTFEIPRSAAGLTLSYEPPDGSGMRIPLPPEFG